MNSDNEQLDSEIFVADFLHKLDLELKTSYLITGLT